MALYNQWNILYKHFVYKVVSCSLKFLIFLFCVYVDTHKRKLYTQNKTIIKRINFIICQWHKKPAYN